MKWIFVSPHLDDAVFSCGGLIADRTARGDPVEVCTIFAGQADSPLSRFARHMHSLWNLAEDAAAVRRSEDARACFRLGATWRHLDYLDAMYRRQPGTGVPLYPSNVAIFGAVNPGEFGYPALLAEALSGFLPADAIVAAPIGLGRHVDHLLARRAVERTGRRFLCYEDFPYSRAPASDRDRKRLLDAGWKTEFHPLTPAAVEAWEQAIRSYVSQMPHFWPQPETLRRDLARQTSGFEGLQLWHPPEGQDAAIDARAEKKVLLVFHPSSPISPREPVGGGASSMVDLAGALRRAGCRVTVAGLLAEGRNYTHDGVAYRNLGRDYALDALFAELAPEGVDVVYADRGFVLLRAWALLPDAIRILGAVDFFPDAHRIAARRVNQVAHRVIAVSQYIAKRIIEWGIAPEKVAVIHEGIDTDLFCRRGGIPPETGRVIYAGATVPGKGLVILLRAFEQLLRRFPTARLDIYGSSNLWFEGREFLSWRRITAEQPAIHYWGARTKAELAVAFNRAAVCVVPTNPKLMQEGFTRVSLEAQACGCPVVASRSGGLPETIVPGETGIVVDPLGPRELADALYDLLADERRRSRMAAAAAIHGAGFTAQRRAREILDALRPGSNELPLALSEVAPGMRG
jgi:glycosyltransferase involved in cell wall biosynthesis